MDCSVLRIFFLFYILNSKNNKYISLNLLISHFPTLLIAGNPVQSLQSAIHLESIKQLLHLSLCKIQLALQLLYPQMYDSP